MYEALRRASVYFLIGKEVFLKGFPISIFRRNILSKKFVKKATFNCGL